MFYGTTTFTHYYGDAFKNFLLGSTHLDIGVDSCPLDRVLVSVHDHRPGHDRDVLQDLLLHLGQRRDVREVTLKYDQECIFKLLHILASQF